MKTLLVLVVLCVAAPVAAQGPQRMRPAPPVITWRADSVSIPLKTFRGGTPVIDVMVNGRGPFSFILDTGAGGNVVTKAFADSLGLPALGEARIGSPLGGTPQTATISSIDSLVIGGLKLEKVHTVASAMGEMLGGPTGPKGVLSPSMLQGSLLTLDFPRQRLVIQPGALPEPDGKDVFGWDTTARLPEIPVILPGGETVNAHLDTGSPGGLTLPSSWIEKLTLASPPESAGVAKTVDRTFVRKQAPLKGDVTIGRHVYRNPMLTFAEPVRDGNVGMQWMSGFAITLDPRQRRLRLAGKAVVTPAPAPAPTIKAP